MVSALPSAVLHEYLPGTWTIKATNFPMWLKGDRLSPRFTYGVISQDPFVLSDDVSYLTAEGEEKHVIGTDQETPHGFVWRGKGWLRFFASHWSVAGANPEGTVLVIRFEKTRVTPAGLDIIVREGVEVPELRTLVAHNTEHFGISAEDFASLTWL
jgi:hypothetical protein